MKKIINKIFILQNLYFTKMKVWGELQHKYNVVWSFLWLVMSNTLPHVMSLESVTVARRDLSAVEWHCGYCRHSVLTKKTNVQKLFVVRYRSAELYWYCTTYCIKGKAHQMADEGFKKREMENNKQTLETHLIVRLMLNKSFLPKNYTTGDIGICW